METLFLGLATFAVVCAAPGPAILTVVQTAMAHGLRAALALSIGLSLTLGLWGLLAAAGFGTVLAAAPSALFAFKLFGGAYLLWLAWGSARSARAPQAEVALTAQSLRAGLLLNLSNPKAVLAWMAAIALGAPPDASELAWLLVPMATFAALGIYCGYGLIFSRAPMRRAYASVRLWIDGVAAGLFAVAGLALIRDAVRRA